MSLFLRLLLFTLQYCMILSVVNIESGKNLLTAYDCLLPETKYTTLSLVSTPNCKAMTKYESKENTEIQLIQRMRYIPSEYYSCILRRFIVISDCSWTGTSSTLVRGGLRNDIKKLTPNECRDIHKYGYWKVNPVSSIEIKPNSTNSINIVAAGSISNTGVCKGGTWVEHNQEYNGVSVQIEYSLSISNGVSYADLDEDLIKFPFGDFCKYSESSCFTTQGQTLWETKPQSFNNPNCLSMEFQLLYQGAAVIINSTNGKDLNKVLTVSTEDISFALSMNSGKTLCNRLLISTDHPQIYIIPSFKDFDTSLRQVSSTNIDFSSYVNTKFVYVERHIWTQTINLYNELISQKCKIEKQTIQNLLTLAMISPEEFAYALKNEPGHTAIRRGEAVHLASCVPVTVTYKQTGKCYTSLPVTYNNVSKYLSPRSRIITNYAEEVPCSSFLPVLFKLGQNWYNIYPKPIKTHKPNELSPTSITKWKYNPITNLMMSGIYSDKDIKEYQDRTLFPMEKTAIATNLGSVIAGYNLADSWMDMNNLITDSSANQFMDNIRTKMSSWWFKIGYYTAPFVGVAFVLHIISQSFGCGINSVALHRRYGWNWKILFCCCESCAYYFIFLGKYMKTQLNPEDKELRTSNKISYNEEDLCELESIIIEQPARIHEPAILPVEPRP